MLGEIYFLLAVTMACFGYRLTADRSECKFSNVGGLDNGFLVNIVKALMIPMLLALAILIFSLTDGNLLSLFDLSSGNAMKWLRITERNLIVYVSEALFSALIGILLPASVLLLAQKRKSAFTVSMIAYTLYLLSTGSRSPVVGVVLMLIAPIVEFRRRGIYSVAIRRIFFGVIVSVLLLFTAVSLSRDQIEDNSDQMLEAVFNAKRLGFIAEEKLLPNFLQLPVNIVTIYFASTFNNYLIAYEESATMEKSWGYRLFYTEYKALGVLIPMEQSRAEMILFDNTEKLRSISPTGDQWGMSLGTLVLEFGAYFALVVSFLQGILMGWLVKLSRNMENNRRVVIESFLIPVAISAALVHPLMSFSTHIQLAILLIIALKGSRLYKGTVVKGHI
ncbi:hypothetical protein B9Z45_06200 [Limnohabitans sp. 2KL-17]|uniref:oligosaccharide repeat unit polymerase n=1 Tax=Limnohabitans sp. 2KL-17 TaxID=1100704 RepID=UPI000D3663B1|nr:oligosaccharide repeat unit polymerase [Limnohabitans sp. 2KL-17]PUE60911.1 hypothetical protein B9Z45_06200 [Limnohabitans sp. 2KL-17]